jgi:hypothetical protein
MSGDPRVGIWNVLHDGEITAVAHCDDTLTLFVNIPYLRRRLEPLGDSFVLRLRGLKRAEFHDFEGGTTDLRTELEIGSPEILSTDSTTMPVTVETTMGRLILDFRSLDFAMDTGQEIQYETIAKVCEEYWTEWEAKAKTDR